MKLISILVAITVIWSIIRSIMQAVEKLRQDKARGNAPAGRPGAGGAGPGTPPTSARSMHAPVASEAPHPATRSRAEELAMRRKAQLEELRRRRAGKGSSPAPGGLTTRVSSPAPPTATKSIVPMGRMAIAPATRQAPIAPDHAAQQKRQRKLEALRARQEAAAREQAITRSREKVQVTALPMPSMEDEIDPFARSRDKRSRHKSPRVGALRSRMRSQANLRELFLLKELLDPPVAMRDPDSATRTG